MESKGYISRNARFLALISLFAGSVLAGNPDGDRGAELLLPFKQQLKQALLTGLAEGPDKAVAACKVEAPRIASELSVDGVVLGRSSHRLRNPENQAPDWVTPVLDAYVAAESDRKPRSVSLPEGRVGYIEPIVMQPLCLTCHGDVQDSTLVERIRADYPQDRATGFAAGELRGVFWVEYPSVDPSE